MKKFIISLIMLISLCEPVRAEKALETEAAPADVVVAEEITKERELIQEIIDSSPDNLQKMLKEKRIKANSVYRCNTPLVLSIKSMYLGLRNQDLSAFDNAAKKVKILIENGADVNQEICQDNVRLPLAMVLSIPRELVALGKIVDEAIDEQIRSGQGDCDFEGIISKPCKEMTPEDIQLVKTVMNEAFVESNEFFMPKIMEILKILVENGADIDKQDSNHRTALHFAADAPVGTSTEALRYLIVQGADVNVQDIDGNTPLIVAAANKNKEAVDLLIAGGSDKTIRNNIGATYNEVVGYREYLTLDDIRARQ